MFFKIDNKCNCDIPLISVIVPVFNEEMTIDEVLSKLISLKKRMSIEIIVIDDGSVDDTANIISKYSEIIFVQHKKNIGKGAAIKTGLAKSSGQIIVIQDADLEYDVEQIPLLVEPIFNGRADVVYGSRFLGKIEGMSLSHNIGNRILSFVAQILYSKQITDIMTGHKAFKKQILNLIDLKERSFEVEIELTSHIFKNGFKLAEIPITYKYRSKGFAKINYCHGIRSLIKLFWYKLIILRA